MFDFKKLDELKAELTTAESFADVMEFFFDHLGENPEFTALGKQVKSPFMTAVVQRVAEELLGPGVRVTGKRFVLLKKQRFLHGTVQFDGRLVVLFFFKDIDMGMLCCQIGAESRFARFTGYVMESDDPPVLSPTSSKLVH
jgi:hypothetical protein